MAVGGSKVNPETIGEMYDQGSEMLGALMGGSLHYGYWEGPDDDASMEEASERMTDLMVAKLRAGAGRRVLDVGCGTGRPALRLARATGAEVVGVTISHEQVRLATLAAEAEGLGDRVTFRYGDAVSLPFDPESFDAAWLFESLIHMADPQRVLKCVAATLRPGGRLAIANIVQNAPVPEERRAGLEDYFRMTGIVSFAPLAEYPRLIEDSGLVVEEVVDVSDHAVRGTVRNVSERLGQVAIPDVPESAAASEVLKNARAVADAFASTPGIGYAIVVASKP
ncbi:SAM-dependent methyltransferase [Streptomyces sp. NPDC001678]|uniref:SAM-dependent methyltransferase n=1 Tax=Streptomyces sp. NPDC001678 TaxID=3364599 RepID=UPI0036C94BFB